ncbi:thiol reductant ABC exporter subunit CydD [Agromyces archimandritae]|uniref:Thiol reductant ABC exporter subunit CydD n=1 Tax=Agromyces archimandritae TaxID=2781962 RepID=A0A975INR9_9MICO|nr:thiol reductant ABC exporter subunit CydD [Agromyces archimandritae]QTX04883.1 thiol reductant ABC exporter subunit CydD [Agromyces archimandritae]
MRPLDPRLLKRSRAARAALWQGGCLALVQAGAMLAFAWALAELVTGFLAEAGGSGAGGADAPGADAGFALAPAALLAVLAGAALVRAAASWAWEAVGSAGAMRVKAELRAELLAAVDRAGPGGLGRRSSAELATIAGPGLDALDEYFGRYLPQLVSTAIVTPVLVAMIWVADPLSGLILVIVLPLVPVFMALIGMATERVQRRQWESLQSLSRGFVEVVGGLSTLVAYGRAERQIGRIGAVTEEYRARTMRVLRVTFLSGFTLEIAASLSVALVAVAIGLRLVAGDMELGVGLFVLVLAPEVFLPVRNVGAAFHASAEGMTASGEAFAVLEEAEAADAGGAREPDASTAAHGPGDGLEISGLAVRRGDREVVAGLDLAARPGEIVALAGESGAGKSSVLAAILGFAPAEGLVRLGGRPLGRDRLAWAGQTPGLIAGTVAGNIRLGDEGAGPAVLERAMRLAGVDLEPGRSVGTGGQGLSGGQAQRVATARAIHRLLARGLGLLLLDEPSSALDEAYEARLAASLAELAAGGTVVLVATHRPALLAAADRIVTLEHAHA